MSDSYTYDPQDLESILLHKEYVELTPDEKIIVDEHISDEKEYSEMRIALGAIVAHADNNLDIAPRAETRESLMSAFNQKHKGTSSGSSWFSLSNISFRYTLIAGLASVAALIFFFYPKDTKVPQAEVTITETIETPETIVDESHKTTVTDSEVTPEIYEDSRETEGGSYTVAIEDQATPTSDSEDVTFSWTTSNSPNPDLRANSFDNNELSVEMSLDSSYGIANSYHATDLNRNATDSTGGIVSQGYLNGQSMLNAQSANFLTRDGREFNDQAGAFGNVPLPAQEPQRVSDEPDLLNLLHTATDR